MNEIKVKIVLLPTTQGSIESRAMPQGNNIADNTALQGLYGGAKPFVLGASKLGGDDVYWSKTSKYGGWIDGKLTGVNGEANANITISGTDIDNFVLRFDQIAGQWATELKVDNAVFINDDPQFVWTGTKANSHTIQITKWNAPLYPVRITSITVGLTLEFDRSNLKEVVRGSQIVAENAQPNYGVISQYGRLEIYDNDGELLDLAQIGLLKPNISIVIKNYETIIGTYISERWNFKNNIISVDLSDIISKLENKYIEIPRLFKNKKIIYLYNFLKDATTAINYKLMKFAPLSTEQINFFNNTIDYLFLEKCSLLQAWQKFCILTNSNIYVNESGQIEVIYGR